MPTSFNVISLGNFGPLDPIEGDNTDAPDDLMEGSGILVGQTFGGLGTPLLNNFVTFSQGTTYVRGSGDSLDYDVDNTRANDTFRINGGPDQTMDALVMYNATITYIDGTTSPNITAVIFQDTSGNVYWGPEIGSNADQAAMEANGIRSITLNSVNDDTWLGLVDNRQTWNFVTCFTSGTRIAVPGGEVPVETLRSGDLVSTRDNGAQPLRWVGSRECGLVDLATHATLRPIRIAAGAFGADIPAEDLILSRQHRVLIRSDIAMRMFGSSEVLVPAKDLLDLDGVSCLGPQHGRITYYHLLFDKHEIIFANGAPTESLLLGAQSRAAFDSSALEEIALIAPALVAEEHAGEITLPMPRGKRVRNLVARHIKNSKPLLKGDVSLH